jgi:hypothetical protein
MAKDHDKSLGDEPSIAGTGGGGGDQGPQSLGDQATFAGDALDADSQSLGDQSTMGGGGGTDGDMSFDDGMEVVDLSARYTTEGVLGKGSLLDRCRAGAIPLEDAVELTCQLCSALDKAHAADIIHRDIKPANVLMSEDDTPILTDFGLAKDEAADTGQAMAGAVLGTLDFMPPEQRQLSFIQRYAKVQWVPISL